ncbi:MAG: hypothetical protein M1819_000848 [Sarea resinae]|nr:MAG: hypothetical protein M1819_000848 [Sarea resinae]
MTTDTESRKAILSCSAYELRCRLVDDDAKALSGEWTSIIEKIDAEGLNPTLGTPVRDAFCRAVAKVHEDSLSRADKAVWLHTGRLIELDKAISTVRFYADRNRLAHIHINHRAAVEDPDSIGSMLDWVRSNLIDFVGEEGLSLGSIDEITSFLQRTYGERAKIAGKLKSSAGGAEAASGKRSVPSTPKRANHPREQSRAEEKISPITLADRSRKSQTPSASPAAMRAWANSVTPSRLIDEALAKTKRSPSSSSRQPAYSTPLYPRRSKRASELDAVGEPDAKRAKVDFGGQSVAVNMIRRDVATQRTDTGELEDSIFSESPDFATAVLLHNEERRHRKEVERILEESKNHN